MNDHPGPTGLPFDETVDHPHHMGLSRFPVGGAVGVGIEPSQVRLFSS